MKAYIALIEEGENSYSVVFPDVPGVITVGDTYEEAIKNAYEALAFHLEDEAALPQKRTLRQIKETWDDWPDWEKDGNFTVEHIVLGLNGQEGAMGRCVPKALHPAFWYEAGGSKSKAAPQAP